MNSQDAYPLTWPARWPRTESGRRRSASSFSTVRNQGSYGNRRGHSVQEGLDAIYREMRGLGVSRVVISTNLKLRLDGLPRSDQGQPNDPGVAVYFELAGKPVSLACDRWNRVEDNLWAIGKHIEALRGQDRWGVGSIAQAFAGYTALPPPADVRPWWVVLGVSERCTIEEARAAWILGVKRCHPDTGGNDRDMAIINGAWDAARRSLAS